MKSPYLYYPHYYVWILTDQTPAPTRCPLLLLSFSGASFLISHLTDNAVSAAVMVPEMVAVLGTAVFMADANWKGDTSWGVDLAFIRAQGLYLFLSETGLSSSPPWQTLAIPEITFLSFSYCSSCSCCHHRSSSDLEIRASRSTCSRERWRWSFLPCRILRMVRDDVCKCLTHNRHSVKLIVILDFTITRVFKRTARWLDWWIWMSFSSVFCIHFLLQVLLKSSEIAITWS